MGYRCVFDSRPTVRAALTCEGGLKRDFCIRDGVSQLVLKRALIAGIPGQDGSYLAELQLAKGHEVWRLIRRSSSFNTERIEHCYRKSHEEQMNLKPHTANLGDASSVENILSRGTSPTRSTIGPPCHERS